MVSSNLPLIGSIIPSMCTWDPPTLASAGSVLSARVDNPLGKRCAATLGFADPAVLPITWSFAPISCFGSEVIDFTVPAGVPNGDAFVAWRCEGQELASTCSHVLLTGGAGDLGSTSLQLVGKVGCVSDQHRDATTFITRTASAGLSSSSNTVSLGGSPSSSSSQTATTTSVGKSPSTASAPPTSTWTSGSIPHSTSSMSDTTGDQTSSSFAVRAPTLAAIATVTITTTILSSCSEPTAG